MKRSREILRPYAVTISHVSIRARMHVNTVYMHEKIETVRGRRISRLRFMLQTRCKKHVRFAQNDRGKNGVRFARKDKGKKGMRFAANYKGKERVAPMDKVGGRRRGATRSGGHSLD